MGGGEGNKGPFFFLFKVPFCTSYVCVVTLPTAMVTMITFVIMLSIPCCFGGHPFGYLFFWCALCHMPTRWWHWNERAWEAFLSMSPPPLPSFFFFLTTNVWRDEVSHGCIHALYYCILHSTVHAPYSTRMCRAKVAS